MSNMGWMDKFAEVIVMFISSLFCDKFDFCFDRIFYITNS